MAVARPLLWCLGLGAAATGLPFLHVSLPFAASLAGALTGASAGNFAHEVFLALDRRLFGRLLEGRSGVAENHVVVRSLREAQLAALEDIRKQFEGAWSEDARLFNTKLKAFIAEQRKPAQLLAFAKDGGSDAEEKMLRQAVLDVLPETLDQALAARRDNGDLAAIEESKDQIRRTVEAPVLAELRFALLSPGSAFPSPFLALFSDSREGWFDLFVRDAADRIKGSAHQDGEAFGKIWDAEQTAIIKAIVAANASVLHDIKGDTGKLLVGQDAIAREVSQLLAILQHSDVLQRAAAEGISEASVRSIVLRLGGEGISKEDLLPWLDNWIEAARLELGRRSNEGDAFEAARLEAERRFKGGRIHEASSSLMEEFAREGRSELERQDERQRARIRLVEEAIRFDELALDIESAIDKMRLLARLAHAENADEIAASLTSRADTFFERGRDQGQNAALLMAIAAYRAALEEYTRDRVPLDWAATQNNLGNALCTLGGRESGTERLFEAVDAYRDALKEWTRERAPLQWATTQNNLGNALWTLGERENGTERLFEAVDAYRDALKERTRERVPLQWATTQNNLGNALALLNERL